MKSTHRSDVVTWSHFDEARNLDFNSFAWLRPGGAVVIDPLPLSGHDLAELDVAGVSLIVVTNSDHSRDAAALAKRFAAPIAGPAAERGTLALEVQRWLSDGDEVVPGLRAFELQGSKTPGELAFLLEETTLVTGDLIRGQMGGRLNLLPDAKLKDRAAALASVTRLLTHERIDAVLVGDGWPVFRDGLKRLQELVA